MKNKFINLKSIITATLIFVMLMQFICFANGANVVTAETADTIYTRQAIVLSELALIDKDKTVVTKADFAAAVAKMRGFGGDSPTVALPFGDVLPDHAAAGAIGFLIENNLIDKDEEKFFPNEAVSYDFALKLCGDVLGYKKIAEAIGGYYAVTEVNNLFSGLTTDDNGAFDAQAARMILYRLMHTELLSQTSYGDIDEYDVFKENTLINAYCDIVSGKGRVQATEYAHDGTSSTVGKNSIKIDEAVYQYTDIKYSYLLGREVEYYCVVNEDEQSLLFAVPVDEENVYSVDAEDIISYSNHKLQVYEKERRKTVSISETATIIYNGKNITSEQYSNALFKPISGNLFMINSKDTPGYDIIFINNANHIVVDVISKNGLLYSFSDRFVSSDTAILDYDDSDKEYYICNMAGIEIEPESITENDVLSVYESFDGKLVKIVVCRKTVVGKVEYASKDGIGVNGVEYEISPDYAVASLSSLIGADVTLHFNEYGNVSAITRSKNTGYTVAYVEEMLVSGTIGNDLEIKMFDSAGNWKICKITDGITVDNVRYTSSNYDELVRYFSENGAFVPQVVTFKEDSNGKITSMSTSIPGDKEALHKLDTYANMQTAYSGYYGSYYKSGQKYFDGGIFMDDDPVIFAIPRGNHYEEKDYAILSASYFTNDYFYEIDAYRTDGENGLANVIVCYHYPKYDATNLNPSGGVRKPFGRSFERPSAIITKISPVMDEDGTIVKQLDMVSLRNGSKLSYLLRWEDQLADINVGTVIRYYTGPGGYLTDIEKVFDCNTETFGTPRMLYSGTGITSYVMFNDRIAADSYSASPSSLFANWRLAVLDVVSVNDGLLKCAVGDLKTASASSMPTNLYKLSSIKNVYKYSKGTRKLTAATAGQFAGYENNPDGYSRIVAISAYFGAPQSIIILED